MRQLFFLFAALLLLCMNTIHAQQKETPTNKLQSPKEAMFHHLYYLQSGETYYNAAAAARALTGITKFPVVKLIRPKKRRKPAVYDTIPAPRPNKELIEQSIKLKQILDGMGLRVNLNLIPDDPEYGDTINNNHVFTPFPIELPEVYLVKIDGDSTWRYADITISSINSLHKRVYPMGSHLLLEWLPQLGNQTFLGLAAWQYLGMALLLLLGAAFQLLAWRLVKMALVLFARTKYGKNHYQEDLALTLSHNIGYLISVYVVHLFLPTLMLPVNFSSYIFTTLRILETYFFIRICLNVVEYSRSYFLSMVAKTESTSDDQLLPIFLRTLKTLIIVAGALNILNILHINITALIAGLSIGGLALALAAQETAKNLIASIMIYADKPFQLGDFITCGSISGVVTDIGFRSTRIKTPESSIITVPNGMLTDMVVDNLGVREFRRFSTTIGVAYYTPPSLIEKFVEGLRKINEMHPRTKKDQFFIHLNNMGGSSLDIMFIIYFETNDFSSELRYKEDVILSILRLAEAMNVHIAFPSQSVYIESMPERKGQMPAYNKAELQDAEKDTDQFFKDLALRNDKTYSNEQLSIRRVRGADDDDL